MQSFLNDESDSKSDNSGSNWTENLAYCAPKRKVKVNVTIQESPRTVRRKKYKINVQSSADNENMPHNVPQIVPGYKINVQSADYENVPDNVSKTVKKGGGRETGVKDENMVDAETAKLVQNLKERLKTFDEDLGAKNLFFLLSFPQNERKIYYFCSVSFAQFIYYLLDAATLSGILKAKQKLGRTFNSDKLGDIAFTKRGNAQKGL